MWSLFALLMSSQAQPELTHKCATLNRLRYSPPLITNLEVPPPKKMKQERDSMCPNCNTISSDNFALRWGSGVSLEQAQTVLDSLNMLGP